MPSTPVKHIKSITKWDSPVHRQGLVACFHREGYKLTEIASKLSCSVQQTVRRDFIEIGVESFSDINDAALDGKVLEIIGISHQAVGLTKVVDYLKSQGLRVQQNRVKEALVIITNNRYPCQQ